MAWSFSLFNRWTAVCIWEKKKSLHLAPLYPFIFIKDHVQRENVNKRFSPLEDDRPIKHLIQPGPGVPLCPAKQHNSYTIYRVCSVQVADKLWGRTCQLIQPLDQEPYRQQDSSPEEVPHHAGADMQTLMDYSKFSSRFLENLFYWL